MVNSFEEFCGELIKCGFSMGGGNAKGIHAVIPFDWNSTPEDSRIRWHTGDPETDPWEWRMRVLKERDDIAYAKVFFGTSGYITKEWYPLFLTVRRHGMVFDEWYDEGKASQMESSIYKAISENGQVALHDLKRICSIQKEDASRFDRALVSLQGYGWNSTVFCTVEDFWKEDLSTALSPQDACQAIRDQILKLNPQAQEKNIRKFIQA